jgi:hypothetical protein
MGGQGARTRLNQRHRFECPSPLLAATVFDRADLGSRVVRDQRCAVLDGGTRNHQIEVSLACDGYPAAA